MGFSTFAHLHMHRILAYIMFILFFVSSTGEIVLSIYKFSENSTISWMIDTDEEEGADQELKMEKQEKLFVLHPFLTGVTAESGQEGSKRHFYMHLFAMNDDNFSRMIDSPPDRA
mgnify:CR=1 FL=1